MPTSSGAQAEFAAVQSRLKAIMEPYEGGSLKAKANKPGNYVLVGPATESSRGREVSFGSVQIRKNYVSYHLMPVYVFPDLLDRISPELRKRMQGKSCFNFKRLDEKLFRELARLTDKGYKRFKKAKLIK
jgi:hypothetical protein